MSLIHLRLLRLPFLSFFFLSSSSSCFLLLPLILVHLLHLFPLPHPRTHSQMQHLFLPILQRLQPIGVRLTSPPAPRPMGRLLERRRRRGRGDGGKEPLLLLLLLLIKQGAHPHLVHRRLKDGKTLIR